MLNRSEEKLIRGLGRRRGRQAEGLFLAEGVRVTEELLTSGIVPRMVLVTPALEETERGRALRSALEARAAVRRVGEPVLGRLSDTRTHQGVLVVAETPRATLADIRPGQRSTVLVLDGVQDPGNLGTLARAAVAFGCAMMACLPGTVDPWNPKAVRASAGALFRIAVVDAQPEALWGWLTEHRFRSLGADAAGEPVDRVGLDPPAALVVGNEGAGLRDTTRAACSALVAVPMAAGAESLNVGLAAGILLYLITRERA